MGFVRKLYEFLNPKFQNLALEYPVEFKSRFGHGKKSHPLLLEIIEAERKTYEACIEEILKFKSTFHEISADQIEGNSIAPYWKNDFLPGLDIVALYTILTKANPEVYLEIGSGNSTKVAFKAKKEQKLKSKIVSIDPFPRAEIDNLSDEVIRTPLEEFDLDYFETLPKNTIIFVDNSHRVLPNSDATVFFMEVLPKLASGTIVHIHDIYIPDDYPQFMCDRFYSEQYTLAAFIMSNPKRYKTLFPAWFVHTDPSLSKKLEPLWEHDNLKETERHGGSYWIEIA